MHLGEGAIMAANCDEAMPPVGARTIQSPTTIHEASSTSSAPS